MANSDPQNKIYSDDNLSLQKYLKTKDIYYLGELFNKYMHLVYGVCLKYMGSREDAQDSTVEIFELLITKVEKSDIHEFKAWLYVVTKNFCLGKLRKLNSEQKKLETYYDIFWRENVESLYDLHLIDGMNLDIEQKEKLKNCIEKLKGQQKECINLFYNKENCYKEISEILGINEKAVKSHIQNAKRNLKICMTR